jgi:coiled-coil domain-containing protein 39
VQNQIFRGNEKMDKLKLEMNWNQEELEQWVLAARQKEEDTLTMEKYKLTDEAKIKELNLQIEKLTVETTRKQTELDKEITETQTAQIELDKTAEEFR